MKDSYDQSEDLGGEATNPQVSGREAIQAAQMQQMREAYMAQQSRMANPMQHLPSPQGLFLQSGSFSNIPPHLLNLPLPGEGFSNMTLQRLNLPTQNRALSTTPLQMMGLQGQTFRPNLTFHATPAALPTDHPALSHHPHCQATGRAPGRIHSIQHPILHDPTRPGHLGMLRAPPSRHNVSQQSLAPYSSSNGKDEQALQLKGREYRDLAVDPESNKPSLIPIRRSKKDQTFPVVLYGILSNTECNEFISWLPHGRSFKVHNPEKVEEKVLPLYFQHTKLASFMRQVNGWGFRRMPTGPDRNSYYHEMFLRGFPYLCDKMRRPVNSIKSTSDLMSPPNFYDTKAFSQLPSDAEASPNNISSPASTAAGESESENLCKEKTNCSGTTFDGGAQGVGDRSILMSTGGSDTGSSDQWPTNQMTRKMYGMNNLYKTGSEAADQDSSGIRSTLFGSNSGSDNAPHGCPSDSGSSLEGETSLSGLTHSLAMRGSSISPARFSSREGSENEGQEGIGSGGTSNDGSSSGKSERARNGISSDCFSSHKGSENGGEEGTGSCSTFHDASSSDTSEPTRNVSSHTDSENE